MLATTSWQFALEAMLYLGMPFDRLGLIACR